jgi:hypothetical protein
MATEYQVNGTTADIAPVDQTWRQVLIGRSHDQRAIYSGNWEIDLVFPPASITYGQQWLNAASSGSANLTVLDKYQIGYTDLSAVQLEVVQFPRVTAGHFGEWTMVVRGASPNS